MWELQRRPELMHSVFASTFLNPMSRAMRASLDATPPYKNIAHPVQHKQALALVETLSHDPNVSSDGSMLVMARSRVTILSR